MLELIVARVIVDLKIVAGGIVVGFLEPECEPELVALALQHLAKGWVATEENCDLSEKMFKLFLSQVDCLCLWGGGRLTLPIFCSLIFANTWATSMLENVI